MGSGTYPLGNGLRHSLTVIDSPIAGRVLSDQRDDHCLIMKVGVGGAFVAAEQPPAYGEPVTLRIGAGPSAFEVAGVVRWLDAGGFGVQFGMTGARETAALARLIQAA